MDFKQTAFLKLISLCIFSGPLTLQSSFANTEVHDLVKELATTNETTLDGFLQKNTTLGDNRTFDYGYEDDIREFSSIRIPLSRSLQAAKSTVETPRLVSVFPAKHIGDPPSFLGFIQGNSSGEAIIFNSSRQKYDFKLVERASSGNAFVLKDSPVGLCVKCHQGEGPIFPAGPWFETEVSFADEYKMNRHQIGIALAKAEILDKSTRVSNEVLQSKKVCQNLCKNDDLNCRTKLLLMELQIQGGSHFEMSATLSEWVTQTQFTDDFSHASSVLPSHGNFDQYPNKISAELFYFKKNSSERAYTCSLQDLKLLASEGRLDYNEESAFDLRGFNHPESLLCPDLGLGTPISPLFQRPKVGALNTKSILSEFPRIVSHCFSITQDAIVTSKQLGLSTITQTLNRSECQKKLFIGQNLALNSENLNEILKGNCEGASDVPQKMLIQSQVADQPTGNSMSKIISLNGKLKATRVEKKQALQLFQTSCLKCHGPGAVIELKIDWSKLRSIKGYIGTKGVTVFDKVNSRAMPFDQSLSDTDKNLLEKILLSE